MKDYNIKFSFRDEADTVLYPQFPIIERRINSIGYNFEGKTVFCDCNEDIGNDLAEYFFLKFKELKLRKLIAVCYLPIEGKQRLRPHLIIVNEMPNQIVYGNDSGLKRVIRICRALEKNPKNTVILKDSECLHPFDPGDEYTILLDGGIDFRCKEYTDLFNESDYFFGDAPILLFDEYMKMASGKKSFIFSLADPDISGIIGWKKIRVWCLYWYRISSDYDWDENVDNIVTDEDGHKWMMIDEPAIFMN